jgi:TldD protein
MRPMRVSRRGFLGGVALVSCGPKPAVVVPQKASLDAGAAPNALEAVLGRAIDTAKKEGATYADARIHQRRFENVSAREDHVVGVSSSELYGIGVRVIAGGAWGFASSSGVTEADAMDAAKRAVALAKADAGPRKRPVELAPAPVEKGKYTTPMQIDPFSVPLADKAALVLSFWPEAKKVAGVAFCSASYEAADEWKLLATSEGTLVEQRIVRVNAGYDLTAKDGKGDFVTREHELSAMQAGWEYLTGSTLVTDARKMGEDVVEKLKAASVTPGANDLILAPSNLWLTIHESVGHPTELDRVLGYEANLAGTSFATLDKLGKLKYASPIVTLYADKTTPGALASCTWDDDGVRTQKWNLVENGVLTAYQTTRDQAAWIGEKASRGTSYAQDHRSVAFQRMPNVSLAPQKKPIGIEEIVAATDAGILVSGSGSWSIDHQRYNFQFGGQMFYEVKKGKIVRALRDVAYQSNSIEFWNNCDMIGGEAAWKLGGAMHDGKGEPGQSNAVSHGCPPARFRQIKILNTKRA